MDIQTTFDALTDLVADVISAGFVSGISQHDATRETARDLRDGALVQALLGAQLARLVGIVANEAERKTVARYDAWRKHPRLGRGPLIDEAEDADVSLNKAVMAAQESPGAASRMELAIAMLRVRAITVAIGPACIYPPHERTAPGRKGPRQRRREITAADVPDEVVAILLRPFGSAEEQAAIVQSLRELENGEHNRGSLVTKIIALIDQLDGHVVLNTIAGRIRRARFERGHGPDGERPSESVSVLRAPQAQPISLSEKTVVPAPARAPALAEASSPSLPGTHMQRSQPASTEASRAADPPAVATLLAGFEQRGSRVPSARERLAQVHAQRRARPQ